MVLEGPQNADMVILIQRLAAPLKDQLLPQILALQKARKSFFKKTIEELASGDSP